MNHRTDLNVALALSFKGIEHLKARFPEKAFTIDGRLVGDIGEVIAALGGDVTLYEVQTPAYDGQTSDGRKVQVKAKFKAKFKDKLTITALAALSSNAPGHQRVARRVL